MIQRLIALVVLALCLASCGDTLDPQQVRTCRQTLPAVSLDADKILVTMVGEAGAPYTMRIDYRVTAHGTTSPSYVLCGFGPSPQDNGIIELRILATPTEIYSPLKLHILQRYWLDQHENSYLADPGPGETAADVPEVSRSVAFLVQSFGNGLPTTAMTMLIAVAYALIFGLVQRINLTFGDFATLGGVVSVSATLLLQAFGLTALALSLTVSALSAIGIATLSGRALERFVFAPLAFRRGQTILIATVAVATIMGESMRLLVGPDNRWTPPVANTAIALVKSEGFVANITPMQITIGIGVTLLSLLVAWMMRRSEFGRRWRAISDDALMASLMGISTRTVLAQTFALASGLAGLAGFIMTAYYGGADVSNGAIIGLKGLVAAVIGGIGSIEGALLGGLALGLFEMIWQAYFPIEHRDIAVMVVLVVMLVFRPGGLFGFGHTSPREV